MTNKTGEVGPVYEVELIDSLPIGGMLQAMPGRKELERVRQVSERTVAAYEVLLQHWNINKQRIEELEAWQKQVESYFGVDIDGREDSKKTN
jgi:hypothetical protein